MDDEVKEDLLTIEDIPKNDEHHHHECMAEKSLSMKQPDITAYSEEVNESKHRYEYKDDLSDYLKRSDVYDKNKSVDVQKLKGDSLNIGLKTQMIIDNLEDKVESLLKSKNN